MSERVTIKSIAKDLGISHMTVSRALSDHPNVLKETRDAVQKRSRELGYVKSAAAKAMRGDRTGIVGLLLPNIVNEFYARFANTLALACETQSLQLIIHLTGDDISGEEKALERLHQVQADGMVMVPAPGQSATALPLLQARRAIQLIRERDIGFATPSILVDDEAAIQDAVAHLVAQGHRRIAYVGAKEALSSGRARLAAYHAGMTIAGLTAEPELIHTEAPSADTGYHSTARILRGGTATALISGGFEISNGALRALLEARLRPAHDFGFVGYGDPSFYAWLDGGISTISVPVEELAHKALEMLTQTPNTRARSASFKAELVIR